MLAFLGNYLLVSCVTVHILTIIWYGEEKYRSILLYFTTFLCLSAFLLLVAAFVFSDFSIKTVFFNSSISKPLIFKIAGTWAGHEGSMLMWIAMLSFISSVFFIYSSDISEPLKKSLIRASSFVQTLFIVFLITTSNPFDNFVGTAKDGMGLNPTLQDFALAIHPPILYLGYVCFFGCFLSSIGCLLFIDERLVLLKTSKFFIHLALFFLTIGIGLGSWWAYRELGWGGYWFFDPVENISLVPWLMGISLHHMLLGSIKNNANLQWSIFLGITCFLFTVTGFVLVRSGIITSVHSFAFSAERGFYLLIVLVTILIPSLFLFFKKFHVLCVNAGRESENKMIIYGNYLWIAAIVALLLGIFYPLYYSQILDQDVAIDPDYYYTIFVPISVPILLLASMAIYPKLKSKKNYIIVVILALIAPMINWYGFSVVGALIIVCSIFLIYSSISYLLLKSSLFEKPVRIRVLSCFISHFGFGLLAFSIVMNNHFSQEQEFAGRVGDVVTNENFSVELVKVKLADNLNYYRQIAEFKIIDKNRNETILKPENRLYKIENTLSQETDIYSFLAYDLYAVISRVEENGTIHAKIQYQPMISMIWLAIFMVAIGFVLFFVKNRDDF